MRAFFGEWPEKGIHKMKKRKALFQTMVFSALVCFGVSACNGGGGGNQSSVRLERISITAAEGKTTLILGDTVQLTSSVDGVEWTSEDQTVATISNTGLVTSLKVGSTKITASKNGYREGTLTIRVDLETIQVTAAGDANELVKGTTLALTANKEGVTWTSSNNDIATVDGGVVTGVAYGQVIISAAKDGFNAGTITLNVVRAAPKGDLSFNDADHFSPTGEWAGYNTSYETPVYEKESASGGTCIAHFAEGCKETLTFSADKAVQAELVMTMLSRTSYSDLTTVFTVKFNGNDVNFTGGYEGGDTYPVADFSLGEFTLINGNNVLEISFLGGAPYLDDLRVYSDEAVNIAVVQPAAKDPVTVNQESLTIVEGQSAQITSSMEGLGFKSNNTAVATVSETGLVTAVGAGETTISVSKVGYATVKVPVTVTANENIINVGMDNVQGEGVNHRSSQNIQDDYKEFIESMDANAVATLSFDVEAAKAGNYKMFLRSRASGGYSSTASDDLATCIELKVNGNVIALSGTISGSSFKLYELGNVALVAGNNTIEIKCLTTAPQMNMFRFVPLA